MAIMSVLEEILISNSRRPNYGSISIAVGEEKMLLPLTMYVRLSASLVKF
jgi:hypothetical protein